VDTLSETLPEPRAALAGDYRWAPLWITHDDEGERHPITKHRDGPGRPVALPSSSTVAFARAHAKEAQGRPLHPQPTRYSTVTDTLRVCW
jgi:hypothetical protein